MSYQLRAENRTKLEKLSLKYPEKKALLLPLLWIIQHQDGYISSEAIHFVAKELNLAATHVYGVITFYTMFRQTPPKKYTLEICQTLSCDLCGSSEILRVAKEAKRDDIEILNVECLGACGYAPMCAINGTYYENLTPTSFSHLLESLK